MTHDPETRLASGMKDLGGALAGVEAGPRVEARIREAYRRAGRLRRVRLVLAWGALAAALAVGVFWKRPGRAPAPAPMAAREQVATEFIPLRRGPVMAPDETWHVYRIELRRAEMRRFGIPVSSEAEQSPVQADVLVGSDGAARAVRFVH